MLSIGQVIKNTNKSLKNKYGKAILCTIIYGIVIYGFSLLSNIITGNPKSLNQEVDIQKTLLGLGFTIGLYIIIIPFSYSYFFNLMDLYREKDFSFLNLYRYTVKYFKKAWCLLGRKLQKLLLPIILLIGSYIFMFIALTVVIVTSHATTVSETVNRAITVSLIIMVITLIIMAVAIIILLIKELLYFPIYYIAYDHQEMTGLEVVNESEKIMKGNRLSYFALAIIYTMAIIVSIISTFGIGLIFIMPYIYFANMVYYDGLINITEVN